MSEWLCPRCHNGDFLWGWGRSDFSEDIIVCAECGWQGVRKELIEKKE